MIMKMKLEEIYCLFIMLKLINFDLKYFFLIFKKRGKIYPNAVRIVKKNHIRVLGLNSKLG